MVQNDDIKSPIYFLQKLKCILSLALENQFPAVKREWSDAVSFDFGEGAQKMNAKTYKLGLWTVAAAVLLALAAMFAVPSTSHAQPGKRICVTHAGGGDYIIEVNRGAVCGKHWYMFQGTYDARAFKERMLTCEETGRWSSTHSFGRRDDDICDGMATAKRRSGHYHEQLDKNGYGWGYINLVCPDFATTLASLFWCESKMDQFKQVVGGLYHRKTGNPSAVATGQCRDAHRCFNPSVLTDFWNIHKDANW